MKHSTIQTVIWDFNGTILNDIDLSTRAINAVLRRRGLPTIDTAQQRELFCFPVSAYYTSLGFDLNTEPHADLSDEFHEGYLAGVGECGLNLGVRELLSDFEGRGIRQFVLSAAEQEMLTAWVDMLDLTNVFTGVYGLSDRLAATKAGRGEELMRTFEVDGETTLFIGDTDHDIEVARGLGCQAVAVAQGHQGRPRLENMGAEVFDTFGDLQSGLGEVLCLKTT
jgi:phosphoglycolate phosphatase